MNTLLKKVFRKLKKIQVESSKRRKCISLKPKGASRGNVLLSTDTRDFIRSKKGETSSRWHSFAWENIQQANTFLELGYSVDVIDYDNSQFSPSKEYAFFLDVFANLEILSPKLNESCVKILYPVWSHWAFHNKALYDRLLTIQDRKNVTLKPRRILKPNFSLEHADYIVQRGNRYTASTYDYAGKPTYFVRHSSTVSYPFNQDKSYEAGRKRYLWIGSNGVYFKGLDLVLETFAKMPDYHLTVCGPVQKEMDFAQAFHKELYDTPNIDALGWVDTTSSEFSKVIKECNALIYPSASELTAGAVITCLHAGLIPVISYQSGVDVGDTGLTLETCSLEEIEQSINTISKLPIQQIKDMSRNAWEYARANYTRERYAEDYRNAISAIIEDSGQK